MVVVVVFPFVPVIPTSELSETSYASSTSVITGIPFSIARTTIGFEYIIPGFFTTHSKSSSSNSTGCPPVTTLIPDSNNSCASGFSSKFL